MTAALPATASTAAPSHCTVAVVWGAHVVSHVYPASVPVESFLDDAVELVAADLKKRGVTGPESATPYELCRVNGVRLDSAKTLDELGVSDGTTLVLAESSDREPFEPQCESLSTALATAGRALFPPVTARTAAHTAIAILGLVAAAVLAGAGYSRVSSESCKPAIVAVTYGAMLAAGAAAVRRWRPEHANLTAGMAWTSVPPLAFGAAVLAPGRLGSPHVFIGALAALALSGGVGALTRCHTAGPAAAVTASGITGTVAGVRMWHPVPAQWIGMGLLVGLLVLVTASPTVALRVARLRPPHFGSVTGRDLFGRSDGMSSGAVTPVVADASAGPADPTPTGSGIAAAALRANGILTGVCMVVGLALPVAGWLTVMPGRPRGTGAAALVAVFVAIFISRARSFTDRRQAVALVLGSAAAFCVAVVRYAVTEPDGATLLWTTALLVGFGASGLTAGLLVPVTRFTPMVRMVAEWVELFAIAAALPLAAWVGGLFALVRQR